jgi:hypothetical protein
MSKFNEGFFLITKRLFAVILNGVYLFILFTLINSIIAITLSIVGIKFIVDTKLLVLIGSAIYSYLGDVHLSRWPSIAKKIFGISIILDNPSCNKYLWLGIRTTFYYSFIALCYLSYVTLRKALSPLPEEIAQQAIMFPYEIGFLFFTNLIIPISVLMSGGKRGVHDIISHARVVSNKDKQPNHSADGRILINGLATSLILAVVFSFVVSAHQSRLLSKEARSFGEMINSQVQIRLDKLPFAFRDEAQFAIGRSNYLIMLGGNNKLGSLRAWVDVSGDINKRIALGRGLGLCSQETDKYCRVEASGIFGYAIYDGVIESDIKLVRIDNKAIALLPAGKKIFRVIVFVDATVLNYQEMLQNIRDTILSSVTKYPQFYDIYDVFSIRVEHLVKVGWVSLARCDDVFIPVDSGGLWRHYSRVPCLEPDFTDPFTYAQQYIWYYDIK